MNYNQIVFLRILIGASGFACGAFIAYMLSEWFTSANISDERRKNGRKFACLAIPVFLLLCYTMFWALGVDPKDAKVQ